SWGQIRVGAGGEGHDGQASRPADAIFIPVDHSRPCRGRKGQIRFTTGRGVPCSAMRQPHPPSPRGTVTIVINCHPSTAMVPICPRSWLRFRCGFDALSLSFGCGFAVGSLLLHWLSDAGEIEAESAKAPRVRTNLCFAGGLPEKKRRQAVGTTV